MGSYVLDEPDFVEHHYLRDECYRLEPEAVAPHKLPRRPPAVYDQGQHQSRREEHHEVREIVAQGIVRLYVKLGNHSFQIIPSVKIKMLFPLTVQ